MAGFSKNLSLAREIVEWLPTSNIRLVGICIYGDARPPLLAPNLKSLSTPFRELCVRILSHIAEPQSGQLIFDQRLGAQEDISVAVYNYLAGIRENQRLNPHLISLADMPQVMKKSLSTTKKSSKFKPMAKTIGTVACLGSCVSNGKAMTIL